MNIDYGTNTHNEVFKEIVNLNQNHNGILYNKPYINHKTIESNRTL